MDDTTIPEFNAAEYQRYREAQLRQQAKEAADKALGSRIKAVGSRAKDVGSAIPRRLSLAGIKAALASDLTRNILMLIGVAAMVWIGLHIESVTYTRDHNGKSYIRVPYR
tara:strand:- start:496 stop:825 length:330 start_codon:yes stop_codon:yes gene_type:complete